MSSTGEALPLEVSRNKLNYTPRLCDARWGGLCHFINVFSFTLGLIIHLLLQ